MALSPPNPFPHARPSKLIGRPKSRARAKQPKPIDPKSLHGLNRLSRVAELLKSVHDSGCARDRAGNRLLHMDDYVMLVLVYLMNPMVDSMRTLLRVSELPQVQKRLGIKRFSLGSFSESCTVFEPERLRGIVEQLAKELRPVDRPQVLKDLPGKLTLVDGSVLDTIATVTQAMYLPRENGKHTYAYRLHLQLDVDHHVPCSWEITEPKNTGKSDEKNALRRALKPGHTYVMDRWYAQFTLWNDIKKAASSYVCRVRDNITYRVLQDRGLDADALKANVISDQIVEMGLSKNPDERADHPTRLVYVKCSPHQKRGKGRRQGSGQSGPTSDGVLRIATDLLDVPAHVIAFLYEYRWTIEVFLRFFKQTLGCRHLLSTKPNGITIQIYAAVIVCMLLNVLTGKKPTKWMVMLANLYLQGLATSSDVIRELSRVDNTGVKLRARQAEFQKLIGG